MSALSSSLMRKVSSIEQIISVLPFAVDVGVSVSFEKTVSSARMFGVEDERVAIPARRMIIYIVPEESEY